MAHRQIFVIGAGAMAEAFIRGVTKAGVARPQDIRVINRSRVERLTTLVQQYGVQAAASWSDATGADLVVLAVKPADVTEALRLAAPHLNRPLLLSFAAGVNQSYIADRCPGVGTVRAMPNLPVSVQCGVTAVAYGPGVSDADRAYVFELLSALGDVVEIPEHLMDAATAVSGSGPGFLCYFLEGMEAAAIRLGFSPELARKLLVKTMAGTALTLSEWGVSPETLRQRVMSPKGTTEAGVKQLDAGYVRGYVYEAVLAAAARSAEMGKAYQLAPSESNPGD